MTIRLNGEPFEIAGPVTISALLAELNIDPRIVAVEHNVVVVKTSAVRRRRWWARETRSKSCDSSAADERDEQSVPVPCQKPGAFI